MCAQWKTEQSGPKIGWSGAECGADVAENDGAWDGKSQSADRVECCFQERELCYFQAESMRFLKCYMCETPQDLLKLTVSSPSSASDLTTYAVLF